MLKLAVEHYLKSIQDKHFIPNPDNAEWTDSSCLDVAIKRRPKWFWQKDIYTYDNFGLNSLLDPLIPIDKDKYLKPPESVSPNFTWTSKHDISSKLGGKLASLLSLDFSFDDSLSLSINIEGIMKQSIDFVAVAKLLNSQRVDLSSQYVRHIAHNRYNVVCLIAQYLYVTKPIEIKIGSNLDISEGFETTKAKVSANESAGVNSQKIRSIVFEAGTRLAFDFCEMLINSDGTVELIDHSEDFHPKIMIPELDNDISVNDGKGNSLEYKEALNEIMSNKSSRDISKSLLLLGIHNKMSMKQLELFLTECQSISSGGQGSVNPPTFNVNDSSILYLLKQIGYDLKKKGNIVKIEQLNFKIINEKLLKIQSIYHLETPQQQTLLDIMKECSSRTLKNLLSYMQNLRKPNYFDKNLYEKLITNKKIKLLFLSVGVIADKVELNEYFEPTVVLLQG